MLCPKCGSNLRQTRYETVDIHTCNSCGGEALRAEALRAIVRRREQRFPQELTTTLDDRKPAFGVPTEETARAITCPRSLHRVRHDIPRARRTREDSGHHGAVRG
jgi:Zn-finger nucleic acid-binding protein